MKKIYCSFFLLLMSFSCAPDRIDLTINNYSDNDIIMFRKSDLEINNKNDLQKLFAKNFFLKRTVKSKSKLNLLDYKYELDFFTDINNEGYIFYFYKINYYKNGDFKSFNEHYDSLFVKKNNFIVGKLKNNIIIENFKIRFTN